MSLEAESILAEARQKTGLDDFGDDSFREPMERLLRSMEEEADLSATGRAMQRARVVGLLVNRLRAEDHFGRFPEILEEEIREPLVIVGLARTGTTMLHRMIASDPLRVLAALVGVAKPRALSGVGRWGRRARDPRIRRCRGRGGGHDRRRSGSRRHAPHRGRGAGRGDHAARALLLQHQPRGLRQCADLQRLARRSRTRLRATAT